MYKVLDSFVQTHIINLGKYKQDHVTYAINTYAHICTLSTYLHKKQYDVSIIPFT